MRDQSHPPPSDVRGSGGGKSSGSGGSSEDPNSLRSRSVAKIIDVLCEGQIADLVDGAKAIYLDGTPLMAENGEYNFDGVAWEVRNGTPDQEPFGGFTDTEAEIQVSTQVTQNVPVTRTINEPGIDDLRVKIMLPALYEVDTDSGDIHGTSVEIKISIKGTNTSYTEVVAATIDGKTNSQYERAYRITDIAQYGECPWTVKVERITEDSSEASLQNDTYFSSYTTIINQRFSMPDVAAVAIQIDAEQFGSHIPTRSYEIWGYNQCRIPTNYDRDTRTYSGMWDGTFKYDWTDNPAWVWLELVTNERFGLPDFDISYINKWRLYEIAKYCDELVDDGYGGQEPRFSCNLYLQTQEEAYHVINALASAFLAMPYWSAALLDLAQDRPTSPSHLATPANVHDGEFHYSGTGLKSRYSVALVTWNDPDDEYRAAIEPVEDPYLIERYGWRKTDVLAVGCTSRAQAIRFGRWVLYSGRYEKETVTFKGGFEFADCVPGSVVQVQDPHYQLVRFGGRIAAATINTVTLDAPVTLEAGYDYNISVMLPDKSVVEREVANGAGTTSTIMVVGNFGQAPEPFAVWVISRTDLSKRLFRVVGNVETAPNEFEITATEYVEAKYAAIFDDVVIDPPPYNPPGGVIEPPTNLNVTVYSYEEGSNFLWGALFSWTQSTDARVMYYDTAMKGVGDWRTIGQTSGASVDVKPIGAGTYSFRVRACGVGYSDWVTLDGVVVGDPTDAVPNVTGLQVAGGGTSFSGADCEVVWNSVIGQDGFPESRFAYYLVTVRNASTSAVVRQEQVYEESYWYTYEKNQQDFGTASRTFKVDVVAVDVYLKSSPDPASITVSNPAPTMAGFTPIIEPMFIGIEVNWSSFSVQDPDLQKFAVYYGTTNPPTILSGYADGTAKSYYIPIELADPAGDGVTYYVKVVPYDVFGAGTGSNVASGFVDPTDILDYLTHRITEGELLPELLARIEEPIEILDAQFLSQLVAHADDPNWVPTWTSGTNYALDAYVKLAQLAVAGQSYSAGVKAILDDGDVYQCSTGGVYHAGEGETEATWTKLSSYPIYKCILGGVSTTWPPNDATAWRAASSLVQALWKALVLGSATEGRVTDAEIAIDAANAQIALKASQVSVDVLTTRVSTAEIDIDGLQAQIVLKASQASVDALTTRVSTAEIDIDGLQAQIVLKASQASVDALTTRVTTAEIDIDGLQATIVLKASQASVDALAIDVDAAQADADAALGRLDAIDDDMIVTPSEKISVNQEWEIIKAEKPILVAQATTFGVSSTTYVAKYDALNTYLTATPGVLINMDANTTVDANFLVRFKEYYTEKVNLLNAIEASNIYLVQSQMALSPNAWTLKIDANGNIAGCGLIAYPNWSANVDYSHFTDSEGVLQRSYVTYNSVVYRTKADPPKGTVPTNTTYWEPTDAFTSEFGILANAFWIVDPDEAAHGSEPIAPFGVYDMGTPGNPNWVVGINADVLVDGSISASKIKTEELFIPWGQYEPPKNARFEIGAKGSSATSGWSGVKYEDANGVFQSLYPPSGVTCKSWNMAVYQRSTKSWYGHFTYDIANNAAAATTLATHLNSTFASGDYICVIYTHGPAGDPVTNAIGNATLVDALRHTGGTYGILNTTSFKHGGAYILVGVPYWGEGNGLEFYSGSSDWSTAAVMDEYFDIDTQYDVLPRKVTQGTNSFNALTMQPLGSTPGLYLTPTNIGYYAGVAVGWTVNIANNGTFYFGSGSLSYEAAAAKFVWWDGNELYIRGKLKADDITSGKIVTDQLWVAGSQITADGAASKVYTVTCANKSSNGSWVEAGRITVATTAGRKYICYGSFEGSSTYDFRCMISVSRDSTVVGRSSDSSIACVDTPATGSFSYILWVYGDTNFSTDPPHSPVSLANIRFHLVEAKV